MEGYYFFLRSAFDSYLLQVCGFFDIGTNEIVDPLEIVPSVSRCFLCLLYSVWSPSAIITSSFSYYLATLLFMALWLGIYLL